MRIIRRWFGALAMVALCATISLFFAACGGGDGGNSGSSSGYIDDDSSSSGGESSNSDAYDLYGTWAGVSGSSIITKLVFASGGRGYIKMNSTTAPYAHNGQFTYTFDSSKGHINIVFNDDGTSATYKINSLSKYESMKLINDYDMTYNMVFSSFSTDIPIEYDDNVVTNIEQANGECISLPKTSQYSSRYYIHYYKKTSDNGTIYLYKDAACQNLVGTASSNTYSSWGGYSVSNYSYIVKTSTSTTWVYYFFN